jgi:membrane associated rhomboid family serine protease
LRIAAGRTLGPRAATIGIAIATAAAYLIASALGLKDQAALALGFIPARLGGLPADFAAVPAWLTPLTATLVHANLLHLGMNMLIFLWCGLLVERVLGSVSLAIIYVVSAYAAALAQWVVDPASLAPMVGASGAASGVIGAFALSFGQQKQIVRNRTVNQLLNALWLLVAWIVLQLMTGFLAGTQGFLLATPAHIGGFIAGLLLQRPLLLWKYRKA